MDFTYNMTFKIKTITVKNFMSVGNQTQAVDFDKNHLTLVLGENLDLGGDDSGSRNGTGKTTIVNALSYALYGEALTKIKKENLINKTNGKNMVVTVEFELNGRSYKIERGRKPNFLKFYVDQIEVANKTNNSADDEAQGDSRETQKAIESLMGMSQTMFKHLVALNTYTEPFLSMRANDQREVIEQLLGITLLSEKAEMLKVQLKEVKDNIQAETFKIDSIRNSNEKVQQSIDSLVTKSKAWETKRTTDCQGFQKAITELRSVDIDAEIEKHSKLKVYNEQSAKITALNKQRATLETACSQADKTVNKYVAELERLNSKKCPACEQELHDHKHEEMLETATKHLSDTVAYSDKVRSDLDAVVLELSAIGDINGRPSTYYDTAEEAYNHRNNVESLEKALADKQTEDNPYLEQIEELKKTALQEISWDTVNSLTTDKDHMEFLHKLLTNKDSFVRKKIIDQNLAYLNKRLSYYLAKSGLPHQVKFLNDLNVEITQLGQDLDFDNLSRGERNRLILSMSWAFRDVWESLYHPINLLFIDELIDSGMDTAGVEAGLAILKKMARERNKNIYLISHKDELAGRVNSILRVIKENGFTSYSNDADVVEAPV
jgi:DNA repair exonuclease SbcCD ATPase subunit